MDDSAIQRAAVALLESLRAGRGVNSVAVEELREALRQAAHNWRQSSVVPKSTANLFADMVPAIDAMSHAYHAEDTQQAIRDLALELADLIRDVLASSADST